ncbi:hypothetical protein GOQ29_10910, partial [Clostridium sp. D2Q-14]|uniref:hypothetical protein n=1 Tax=Anaeromonas gelatinilytica TaxID=2683194 RepID=UPI00193BB30E
MKIRNKIIILMMIFILFFTSIVIADEISEGDALYNAAMEEEDSSTQTKLLIEGYTQYSDHEQFIE